MAQPDPSDSLTITCPVCRAKQTLQPVCRRCSADLELYGYAIRSQHQAARRHAQCMAAGDHAEAERIEQYLTWLRPNDPLPRDKGND